MANEYFDMAKIVTKAEHVRKEDLVFDYLNEINIGLKVLNEAFLFAEANRKGILPDEVYNAMLKTLIHNTTDIEDVKLEEVPTP